MVCVLLPQQCLVLGHTIIVRGDRFVHVTAHTDLVAMQVHFHRAEFDTSSSKMELYSCVSGFLSAAGMSIGPALPPLLGGVQLACPGFVMTVWLQFALISPSG